MIGSMFRARLLLLPLVAVLCSSPASMEWSELQQPWFASSDISDALKYVKRLDKSAFQQALLWLEKKDDARAKLALENLYARLTKLNLAHESNKEVRVKLSYVAWHLAKIAERQSRPSASMDMYRMVSDANPNLRPWAVMRMMELSLDVDPRLTDDVLKEFKDQPVMDDFPLQTQWRLYQEVSRQWFDAALDAAKIQRSMGRYLDPSLSANIQNLGEYWRSRLYERMIARLDLDRKQRDVPDAEKKRQAWALEALVGYRKVAHKVPFQDLGRKAQVQADALYIALPDAERGRFRRDSVRESAWVAEALVGAQRLSEAVDAYEALSQREDASPDERDEFVLKQCEVLGRLKARDRLINILNALLASWKQREQGGMTMPSLDFQARAHYQLARAYSNLKRNAEALVEYDWVVAHAPDHRLADDALFKGAMVSKDLGDVAGATKRLESIRQGDMMDEAKFQAGFQAYVARDWARAQTHWSGGVDASLSRAVDRDEGLRGRTVYWLAMAEHRLGHTDLAIRWVTKVIQTFPLSYYGQRACERLAQWSPKQEEAFAACGLPTGLTPLKRAGFVREAQAQLKKLTESRAFIRSLDLLRIQELDASDIELKQEMKRVQTSLDYYPALMRLLFEAGAPTAAIGWARKWVSAASGDDVTSKDWAAAYPYAFEDLIHDVSKQEAIPRSFLTAIAREESSFNPLAVSGAGAVGVVQLMKTTACAQMKEIQATKKVAGLGCDEASLKEPRINLRLGGHLMAFLFKRYPTVALVPSAYNAGYGATDRWLSERPLGNSAGSLVGALGGTLVGGSVGTWEVDAWVEAIPFDESRKYTRRVLQTYGTYVWLDTGRIATTM